MLSKKKHQDKENTVDSAGSISVYSFHLSTSIENMRVVSTLLTIIASRKREMVLDN